MSLMNDMLKMKLLHRSPKWKNKYNNQSWLEPRHRMLKILGRIRGNNGVMVKYKHRRNPQAKMLDLRIGKAMRRVLRLDFHRRPKENVDIVIINSFHRVQVQKLLLRKSLLDLREINQQVLKNQMCFLQIKNHLVPVHKYNNRKMNVRTQRRNKDTVKRMKIYYVLS